MSKIWGHMNAAERLASKIDYLVYNYGEAHLLTVAARGGDLDAFTNAGSHITQDMDFAVTSIIDKHHAEQRFSKDLLLAASAMREVGADRTADLLAKALVEPEMVEDAMQALQRDAEGLQSADDGDEIPWGAPSQKAQEVAIRMHYRLKRSR
ncbi:hypothetical protein ACKU3Z_031555 [Pseudomonas aeruginosa]|uniref:hypothetical protein n=1 Tax=Pseudomonas aeruginosa TaxID=287 RepID=UPI00093F8F83|nr:hypothetical protein [Pseudomonas aeruginosa]EKX3429428.1 hypothetical protein [Pseudomonas aeruginosa]